MEVIKDERVKKIIDKIQEYIKLTRFNGHVYLVGGCVRDSLLNQPIKDVDVVVETKCGGMVLANLLAVREKCFLNGTNPVLFPTYGTAKVNLFKDADLKNLDIEFVDTKSTFEEYEVNNATIEEDSKLRDLTINSLYYNITDGKLYDFNQGLNDLTTQTLRTVNPNLVFAKDPIKMLRIIRFSCELGWDIEKDTWLGIILNASKIKDVPQEKISLELTKILTSPNPSMGIRKLLYCGMLNKIMPDIYDLNNAYESRNPMVTTFDHTMEVLDTVQPLIENRLAALFHDVASVVSGNYNKSITRDAFSAEVAADDLKGMKFSHDVIKSVETAIKYHRIFRIYADGITPPDKKIRKFINLCGTDIGTVIDLMNANNLHQTYDKKKRQVLDILNRIEELDEIEQIQNVKLPINGGDIMRHLGMKRGNPTVGILLEKVKDAYFENPNITKEECLKIVDEEVKVLAV